MIGDELDKIDICSLLDAGQRSAAAADFEAHAREAQSGFFRPPVHPEAICLADRALKKLGASLQSLTSEERAFANAEGLRAYCDLLALKAESARDVTGVFPLRGEIFSRRQRLLPVDNPLAGASSISPEAIRTVQGFSVEEGSLLLSEVFQRFLLAGQAESKWKRPEIASTRVYGPIFDDFIATVGDRRLLDTTISVTRRYAENVRARPKTSSATKAKYLDRIAAVLSWAHAQGMVQDVTAPLRMTPTYRSYEALSVEELRRLFECETYATCSFKKSAEFWAPLLALYTGARVDEIASIRLDAIDEESAVPSILLSPGGGRTGKSDYSRRRVPIHAALFAAGLLTYVAQLRSEGHTELFPEIRSAQRDGKGKRVTDDFQKFRRACGVGAAAGRGTKNFHSFRSTFTTALQCAGVSAEIRRSILGHAPVDVHERTYSQGELPIDQKAAAVAKVRFAFQHPVWRDSARQRRTRRSTAGRVLAIRHALANAGGPAGL